MSLAHMKKGYKWKHYCQRLQRSNSHSSTKEECNDYDCWTLSGNRTSCHLRSSIKMLYVCLFAQFNLVSFGIWLLCVLICVLSYDWPCSSIFVSYTCFVLFNHINFTWLNYGLWNACPCGSIVCLLPFGCDWVVYLIVRSLHLFISKTHTLI